MPLDLADLRSRHGKLVKYGMVSVVAVLTSQTVLIVCSAVFDFRPVWANITSVAIGTIPSYVLNRAWVWGKRGSHHFWREVAPFWFIALLGLGFSTLLVFLASQWSEATLVIAAASLTAFGVLWVVKFWFLNTILFRIEEIVDPLGDEAAA